MASYNVAQITEHDIEKIIPISKNGIEYIKYDFPKRVEKLGYCCEPKGIGSSIFLYLENKEQAIQFVIGKTGIFEVQPETFLKQNEEGFMENVDMKISIIGIEIPKNLKFVLDYAYVMVWFFKKFMI